MDRPMLVMAIVFAIIAAAILAVQYYNEKHPASIDEGDPSDILTEERKELNKPDIYNTGI